MRWHKEDGFRRKGTTLDGHENDKEGLCTLARIMENTWEVCFLLKNERFYARHFTLQNTFNREQSSLL